MTSVKANNLAFSFEVNEGLVNWWVTVDAEVTGKSSGEWVESSVELIGWLIKIAALAVSIEEDDVMTKWKMNGVIKRLVSHIRNNCLSNCFTNLTIIITEVFWEVHLAHGPSSPGDASSSLLMEDERRIRHPWPHEQWQEAISGSLWRNCCIRLLFFSASDGWLIELSILRLKYFAVTV